MRPTFIALGARTPSQVEVTSQPFKRSQFGLFHGKTKQYGNNVPFSLHKTRRTWLPNVQRKRLFSEALQDYVQVKLTTAALKTIKKKGGIDNYVMQTSADILGWRGMQIRLMIRDAQKINATLTDAGSSTNTDESSTQPTAVDAASSSRTPLIPSDPASALKTLESSRAASKFIRYTRRMAAKALGYTGFASAEDTIKYMKQQKTEQDRLLRSKKVSLSQ
ncbi:hypothetical protein GGX14DRAFT_411904 [Mycena pura]|uniref:Large ribosomal subunit protein bL28m n=1 Tax=Mycena pura TaxID=153505 RepID=A0AAD7E6S4_9AGAR|nr:hypothetical protein GGX14DRAFT_411904 [Mycena pura]